MLSSFSFYFVVRQHTDCLQPNISNIFRTALYFFKAGLKKNRGEIVRINKGIKFIKEFCFTYMIKKRMTKRPENKSRGMSVSGISLEGRTQK